MNATEMLDDSYMMITQALDNLPESEWDTPGVCGEWTTKELLAHLASYEYTLVDALNTFLGHEPTPYLLRQVQNGAAFNTQEVEKRRYDTAQQILDEYDDVQVQTASLLAQIPDQKVLQAGTVPWYHQGCSLNDLITVRYNHTCEHCAQITAFREKQKV